MKTTLNQIENPNGIKGAKAQITCPVVGLIKITCLEKFHIA